jgi:hypothetical protein
MVFEDSFIFRIIEPFWKLKKTIQKGKHEFFCKYRDNKQISDLLIKNKFKIIYKENINENNKRYRNKHYPTYIYEAIK